jgi:sarcosine oxidase, subunit beta
VPEPSTPRVVIAGAGIMGTALAYFLAERGVLATVVEKGEVAGGATGLSAGAYRSQFPWAEETAVALRSKDLRNRFEQDHDVDLKYRHVGFVLVGSDDAAEAELRGRRGFQNELGMVAEEIDHTRLRELFPGMHVDDIRFAVYTPDDGWSQPAYVTRAIMDVNRGKGVELVRGEVVEVTTDGSGAVSGVVLADGRTLDADVVVDAAGLGARDLALTTGLDLPITSNRQHQFFSGTVTGFAPETVPNLTDPALGLYLRGRGGEMMLSVADPSEAGRTDVEITEDLRIAAAERTAHRWPSVAATGVPDGFVGVYEATPDRRGLVGAHPGLPGFFYIGGFSGHGFMHGLAVGEAVSGFILDGVWPHVSLDALGVERFADGAEAAWAAAAAITMGGERA